MRRIALAKYLRGRWLDILYRCRYHDRLTQHVNRRHLAEMKRLEELQRKPDHEPNS